MPRKDRPRKTAAVGSQTEIERRLLDALRGGDPLTEAELAASVWGPEHQMTERGIRFALAPALATLMSAFVVRRMPDGRYAPRIKRTEMGSERNSVLETWKPGDAQPANPVWATQRGLKPARRRGTDKKSCKTCGGNGFVFCQECSGGGVGSDGGICLPCRGDGGRDCPDCSPRE